MGNLNKLDTAWGEISELDNRSEGITQTRAQWETEVEKLEEES